MSERWDAIIIGAGHNGLVCAAGLARLGRRVLVLEAATRIGGMAAGAEPVPGVRSSACAHLLDSLSPLVVRELELERHGLRFAERSLETTVVDGDGASLRLETDPRRMHFELRKHVPEDAGRYVAGAGQLARFAEVLAELSTRPPPRLGTDDRIDRKQLVGLGWRLRNLPRDDLRELLRIGLSNVADLVEDRYETGLLRGGIALEATLGGHLGPRSPGTVLSLLHRLAGRGGSSPGLPVGGLGAVVESIARAALAGGAEIRTGAEVAGIEVEDDRACGVRLANGTVLTAKVVVSNADPKRTFLDLLGPRYLDTGFVRRIRNVRARGMTAKLELVLDRLPEFPGLTADEVAGRILLAPDVDALEHAFDCAKHRKLPGFAPMEIVIPTLSDRTLAKGGQQVVSAVVQYVPYALDEGWAGAKERFTDQLVAQLGRIAPDLPQRIVARELLTPVDIEARYRATGGHWHHVELSFDQLLWLRPVPGAQQYSTPVPGLYLCGAGAHPGGGVSGLPGRNAATRIGELEGWR